MGKDEEVFLRMNEKGVRAVTAGVMVVGSLWLIGIAAEGRAEEEVGTRGTPNYQPFSPKQKLSLAQGMAMGESGDVETRAVGRSPFPLNGGAKAPEPGDPAISVGVVDSRASGQPNAQLPTFPQKFEVQGRGCRKPNRDGFAVLQYPLVV
ncbi:MAG TPA: hypothetical protein VF443_04995 [Nitrospira sp.]